MELHGKVISVYQFQGCEWLNVEIEHLQGHLTVPNFNKDWRQPDAMFVAGDQVWIAVTPHWTAYTPDERDMARENAK